MPNYFYWLLANALYSNTLKNPLCVQSFLKFIFFYTILLFFFYYYCECQMGMQMDWHEQQYKMYILDKMYTYITVAHSAEEFSINMECSKGLNNYIFIPTAFDCIAQCSPDPRTKQFALCPFAAVYSNVLATFKCFKNSQNISVKIHLLSNK